MMKLSIDKLLPVILALFLPALNLYSNGILQESSTLDFYQKWLYASCSLYVLWHIIEQTSRIRSKYKVGLTILSISISVAVVYLLLSLSLLEVNENKKWMFIIKFILAAILFLVIQYALNASKDLMQIKLEKEQIQTENYRVQLEALRAKIDPHFLFNSLNTLRTMVRQNEEKSEQFILSLSNFYRQTLKYNESATIKLYEEIKVLESYLFLMKNRNGDAVQVEIDIEDDLFERDILILALQTVVENCFKHNMMTSKQPLKITVRSLSDNRIEIVNNIQPKLNPKEGSGYGLDNLKMRYSLLGIQNGVEVEHSENEFKVKLKLL